MSPSVSSCLILIALKEARAERSVATSAIIDASGLASLETELGRGAGTFQPLNIEDGPAVEAVMKSFGDAADGRLDILFSNAGSDAKGTFADMVWERIVNVNLLGSLAVIQWLTPFRQREIL